MLDETVSYEWLRKKVNRLDKFEVRQALVGTLSATQQVREIGRLHTYRPGARSEMDYTKYVRFMYPNESWNEPLPFQFGIVVDHHAGVIKGETVTAAPSSRDAVRLYRRSVLPAPLWLPERSSALAHDWDVFGLEDLLAIDNALDLTADSVLLMFLTFGVIVLRMPPRRGDFKGTVERTHDTLEQKHVSTQSGYVPFHAKTTSPEYRFLRERAKAEAKDTVEIGEAGFATACVEHNRQPHPRLKKPRIKVWRDGQENLSTSVQS